MPVLTEADIDPAFVSVLESTKRERDSQAYRERADARRALRVEQFDKDDDVFSQTERSFAWRCARWVMRNRYYDKPQHRLSKEKLSERDATLTRIREAILEIPHGHYSLSSIELSAVRRVRTAHSRSASVGAVVGVTSALAIMCALTRKNPFRLLNFARCCAVGLVGVAGCTIGAVLPLFSSMRVLQNLPLDSPLGQDVRSLVTFGNDLKTQREQLKARRHQKIWSSTPPSKPP
eukprot:gnl/Spiro4/15183_TR8177_c0_g1_i1.p1 gnl/Spiro4/15183_TR8177_c0_g1~~gnl/Spiro4/15183_TR8177_c0_g1_i1.p1  ORF type:complete len:234 (-),score=10.21 gnl/Spiro4/15183_TR8177_c0_g1_i1:175-876(-)